VSGEKLRKIAVIIFLR